jgi:hypothetical protein
MRIYKSNKFIEKILAAISMSIIVNKIIKSLVSMLFLLHLIGCMWATAAALSYGNSENTWMTKLDMNDDSNLEKYIAAVYWAAVSIFTVGYGDILP